MINSTAGSFHSPALHAFCRQLSLVNCSSRKLSKHKSFLYRRWALLGGNHYFNSRSLPGGRLGGQSGAPARGRQGHTPNLGQVEALRKLSLTLEPQVLP